MTTDTELYAITREPVPTAAELEARWVWTDALDGLGDPQPARSWSELSANEAVGLD